ncbi:HvfC family RiPP maturation protein [Gilvimarinus polysaccharolyticus]|uniref:HvfC family RiPP maturation protein n=1 Tax=Gilvimarinus polysaccharolyticus TaxID=863921 RepID=UPI000AC039BE|nr:putative DNA-binding domain-containing protein [Gilvimarinus polysaccharolyticus]
MSSLPLAALQQSLTDHLRDPQHHQGPQDVEDRRLAIYRDLIYNNIEGFIAGGFPVLREILNDSHWHAMVRDFVAQHKSQSPYFLEISQEFLLYLQNERRADAGDPPFMLELAHYEWVELALDVALDELPPKPLADNSLLDSVIEVSKLLWCLNYQYPVHLLGPDYQPSEPPAEPTFLLVYRNRADAVQFIHSNAVTVHLLQKLQSAPSNGRTILAQLAVDIKFTDVDRFVALGESILLELYDKDVLWPVT